MSRCLIVQHVAPEGPYAIGDALRARGVATDVRRVDQGDPLPASMDGFDGLVVMGGPMSATSDEGFPTRLRETALLADAVGRGVPTLGVCLGAQLLALATGGSVREGGAGAEVGWGPVELTDDASADELLVGLPRCPTVLHWHGDTLDLPPDSVRLASNSRYPNQAFRVGGAAWGLQFHVEVDAEGVSSFLEASGDEARAAGSDPADILAATPTALDDLSVHRDRITGRFAELVAQEGRREGAGGSEGPGAGGSEGPGAGGSEGPGAGGSERPAAGGSERPAAGGSEAVEATGPTFTLDRLLDVRARTRQAVHAIADQIAAGMSEDQAKAIARRTLSSLGLRRGWHPIIVRCGANTTKSFAQRSEPGVVLGHDDLFFIDIGPVFDGYEGDAGETFVLGGDPGHLRARGDVRTIWEGIRARWFAGGLTGQELYRLASTAAEERGWVLNLDLSGHRLSDFPHSVHYDGSMAGLDLPLHPGRWVLEIAIAHPDGTFGAFYEDLLLEDQAFPEWVVATDRPARPTDAGPDPR